MTKGSKRRIVVVLLVLAAGIGALVLRGRSSQNPGPEMRTAVVERGDVISTVSATGTLQPLTTVDIKSRAGGRVDVLAVDVGSVVRAGQLIAKIDPTDTLTAVRTAQADTEASRAKVQQAQENLRLQTLQNTSQVQQAEEGLRAAQARLAQAQKQAQVQPGLTRSSISEAQAAYDAAVQSQRQLATATVPQTRASAQSAYEDAKANLDSNQESLRMLQQATLPQARAQARSAYDQANANVRVAERDLKRQKSLYSQGFIALADLDTFQNKYDLAVAQANTAKEKMDTLQSEEASNLQTARYRVAQAQAAVANAQRRLQTLDPEMNSQLAAARAKVSQAKAQLDNARGNSVQDNLKQDDVTAAQAAVRQAEANLASARANSLQEQMRQADIETARAGVASSEAKLQNANTNYQQTVITAPRAGVVLQKYVEQGTIITSGTSSVTQGTSIIQLGDTSRMFVQVLVDEADIGSVKVGQPVNITLDAYPNDLFHGRVTRIDPQAQTVQNVTTVMVTVEVDHPDARMVPGMNASCDFIVSRAANVLYVPSDAVKTGRRGQTTVTVLQNGKPVVRQVQTGITGADTTEIRSGLNEGETVVTAMLTPAGSQQDAGAGAGTGRTRTGGGGLRGPGGGGVMGGLPRGGGR